MTAAQAAQSTTRTARTSTRGAATTRAAKDPRLAEAHARLAIEHVAAEARASALARDVAVIVESARAGATDDEHDPEGATVAFERAQAMAMLEETRVQIGELEAAQARITDGTYGRCERCHQDIAAERLAARPVATLCIGCASRRR